MYQISYIQIEFIQDMRDIVMILLETDAVTASMIGLISISAFMLTLVVRNVIIFFLNKD